jgi:hypothetical protein
MKHLAIVILMLIFTGAITAGCLQDIAPGAPAATTPVQTSGVTETPKVPVPRPSFTLGDHYLKKSFSFQSEKDVFSEEVRVDNASWGIGLDVLPLTDNIVYSWFEMKVTNVYSNQTETYGFGRTNGFELKRLIPMYNTGLYKFEFTGSRVKVDVTVAKRNP